MTHPVSVIIPHTPSRAHFLATQCLPSVVAAGPEEIHVIGGPGGASAKRNLGLAKAGCPYVFYCDDDVVLLPGCLAALHAALENEPPAAYAYADYAHQTCPGVPYPVGDGVCRPGPYDPVRLRQGNYISAMALCRRAACPQWDESILRYEDWDYWLTVAGQGGYGVYVGMVLHTSHHIDAGTTVAQPHGHWHSYVAGKHGGRHV